MGVEQDGLGVRVIVGVFYEVKAGRTVAQGNSGGSQVGACALVGGGQAILGRFITVKLDRSACY